MSIRILALTVDAFGARGGIAQYNRDVIAAWSGTAAVGEITILPRFACADPSALPAKVREHRAVGNATHYGLRALGHCFSGARYDVVFCGHLHLVPLALVVARLAGARLWLQLHGIEAWSEPSAWIRWCAERADRVIAVSRHTRRRFLSWTGMDASKAMVAPNTFGDHFRAQADRDEAKRALGLATKRVLLTVSRLARSEGYKGHDRVIRALPALRRKFADLVYVVAGDGDLRPDLEKLAGELGVADAVRFIGHVESGDLPELYRAADLFVMPSTGEGFGIVYLEALACGTPVVAGDADGASDPLQDGRLGSLCDDSRLAGEIARRLEAADETRGDGGHAEHGRERAVRRHFGRDVFEDVIRDITLAMHARDGLS